MMPKWTRLHPDVTSQHLGFIPMWLDNEDPDSASQQIHKHYTFGGGWQPFNGFTGLTANNWLEAPEDPPLRPLASCQLRDELILFYDHAWVAIIQPDRSFEVARID